MSFPVVSTLIEAEQKHQQLWSAQMQKGLPPPLTLTYPLVETQQTQILPPDFVSFENNNKTTNVSDVPFTNPRPI